LWCQEEEEEEDDDDDDEKYLRRGKERSKEGNIIEKHMTSRDHKTATNGVHSGGKKKCFRQDFKHKICNSREQSMS
jgi:hypothetical protein